MLIRLLEVDVYDEGEINTGESEPGWGRGQTWNTKHQIRGFCPLGFLQHPVCRVPVRLKVTCQQVGLSKLWLCSFFEIRSGVLPFFWTPPLGVQPDAGQKKASYEALFSG